jgi:hypothetical protein
VILELEQTMKPPPIPEEAQMRAMLTNSVYELVSEYVEQPSRFNLKQYLTVDRPKLLKFLETYPELAGAYFQRQSALEATHDVERLSQEKSDFLVTSIDRGQPKYSRRFKSLREAVAEHVLLQYGMY